MKHGTVLMFQEIIKTEFFVNDFMVRNARTVPAFHHAQTAHTGGHAIWGGRSEYR